MLNNTKTQSHPKLLFLVPAISQTHKSLENSQDFLSRPILYFFALEVPRDQDFGLEDYTTGLRLTVAQCSVNDFAPGYVPRKYRNTLY